MAGQERGPRRRSYEFRVRGHLGAKMLRAFPAFAARTRGEDTLLTGCLPDQAAVYGLIARLEALGLELVEFRPLPACLRRVPPCPRPSPMSQARHPHLPQQARPPRWFEHVPRGPHVPCFGCRRAGAVRRFWPCGPPGYIYWPGGPQGQYPPAVAIASRAPCRSQPSLAPGAPSLGRPLSSSLSRRREREHVEQPQVA
jgi:hypothetical protein